jgi:hypothetical protein
VSGYAQFLEQYPHLSTLIHENIYGIAGQSIMDAETIYAIARLSGIKFDPLEPETANLLACPSAVRCLERVFDTEVMGRVRARELRV